MSLSPPISTTQRSRRDLGSSSSSNASDDSDTTSYFRTQQAYYLESLIMAAQINLRKMLWDHGELGVSFGFGISLVGLGGWWR